jgi:light-regulated signal transduction histidine kinase (bacteriophytochrome)
VAEDALGDDHHVDRATAAEALERGRHATDRMSNEIDDWLTYNVAREGAVRPEPIELQPVLQSITAMYPTGEFQIETPDTVLADPTLLRHLLVNLIGNAVKYTVPGEVPMVTRCGSTSSTPVSASPSARSSRSSSRSSAPPASRASTTAPAWGSPWPSASCGGTAA